MPLTIPDVDSLRAMVGREVAVSEWMIVDQERIQRFADATDDHQWIHVDGDRARHESPYGTTVAHGFLTLSLLSALLARAITFEQRPRMGINYGLNRVRFTSAVPVNARVRGRFTLTAIEDVANGGVQLTWAVVIECEGLEKPALVAEWLTRRYQ